MPKRSSTDHVTDHAAPTRVARTPEPSRVFDVDAYPRALIESSLAKVLGSAVFRRSERHRRFLRHIVQATLDGQSERLKEVVLGIELFDRKLTDYDPRQDPIVRVEAGRLRQKLARYYEGEGIGDPFSFGMPIGGYVPTIARGDAPVPVDRPVESFAVMPFATDEADDNVAFTIGLADQLINLLGRVRDLKVIARVSAFKARERRLGVKEIGKLLRVTRVVDGSVQRQGDRMRCIAHVYRARDGVVLWSQSFDSQTDGRAADGRLDLFDFQDLVAEAVFAAASPKSEPLRPRPTVGRRPDTVASVGSTDRHQARDLLDRANYLARRYDSEHADQVVALLERATVLDPDNAQAHVALATSFLHQATLLTAPGNTMLPKVETALRRALQLDPNDSDAIALRAMIAFRFRFDWQKSEGLFRDALWISPHASNVNYRFAFGLIMNGRFDEGMRHARAAVDVDPLNLGLRAHAAQLLSFTRDYAGAATRAQDVLELEPTHLYMNYVVAWIHLYQGDPDRALDDFDRLIARHPQHPAAYLGRVCALGWRGDAANAKRELDTYMSANRDRYCPPFNLAKAEFAIGDRVRAYATLDRGAREGDPSVCSAPIDPQFAPAHDDPLFLALLARHGLRTPVP